MNPEGHVRVSLARNVIIVSPPEVVRVPPEDVQVLPLVEWTVPGPGKPPTPPDICAIAATGAKASHKIRANRIIIAPLLD